MMTWTARKRVCLDRLGGLVVSDRRYACMCVGVECCVLLYEVFNDGEKPWPDDEPKRIATHIRRGKMPDLPPQTPDGMKSLVTKIWNLNPEARPTMDDLTRHLRTLHRGEFKVTDFSKLTIRRAERSKTETFVNDESDSHCSLKSGYDDDLEPPSRGGPPTSKKSRRERGIPSKSK
ncbi:hypothetical protein Y032_0009g728 [Ancylostoma ceylanicum]|uniref:Serine-threonine/tyrosine-protein kinase catalytic domain-containing protein n=1 Tax=Ancylostoma ceylanicum TaxID=53326 RepID=A0A016VJ43_9BILA|nr:hypothetical protein Y032_0009g728 [Ancylostoma ceylanicum]